MSLETETLRRSVIYWGKACVDTTSFAIAGLKELDCLGQKTENMGILAESRIGQWLMYHYDIQGRGFRQTPDIWTSPYAAVHVLVALNRLNQPMETFQPMKGMIAPDQDSWPGTLANSILGHATPYGGFSDRRFHPDDPAVPDTDAAVGALKLLGKVEEVDKEAVVKFLVDKCWRDTDEQQGGFANDLLDAQPFSVSTIFGLRILHRLGGNDLIVDKVSGEKRQKIANFISACKAEDGGFSWAPGHPSTVVYTRHVLSLLQRVDIKELRTLKESVNGQQIVEFVSRNANTDKKLGFDGGWGFDPKSPPNVFATRCALDLLHITHDMLGVSIPDINQAMGGKLGKSENFIWALANYGGNEGFRGYVN